MMELAARRLPVEITDLVGRRAELAHVVSLSAGRAAAAVPGFRVTPQNRFWVTPQNMGDVIRLGQRLDGIPLARRARTELRGRA